MKNELFHYGRSKKDGAPGVGTGNWRRPVHWGVRTRQVEDERFTDKERKEYLNTAMMVSDRSLVRTIGVSSTREKQQNRYLKWARTNQERHSNIDKSRKNELMTKEILARKNEAKLYTKALKGAFSDMKEYATKGIPGLYYNEDLIARAFNDSYDRAVIEPAWKRFDSAVSVARNISEDDESFVAFTSDEKLMKRYGYSEEQTAESEYLDLTMDRIAYAEYLLRKGRV